MINSNRKDSSKLQLDIFPKALNESERKIDSSETAKSRKAIYSKVHNSQEFSNWKFLALNNMFDNCDIKERRVSQVALGINTNDDFADSRKPKRNNNLANRLTGRK